LFQIKYLSFIQKKSLAGCKGNVFRGLESICKYRIEMAAGAP